MQQMKYYFAIFGINHSKPQTNSFSQLFIAVYCLFNFFYSSINGWKYLLDFARNVTLYFYDSSRVKSI